VKFSSWLQQNDCLLYVLVCRHLGQWGFECQIIKKSDEISAKDIFLFLVTDPLAQNEALSNSYPNKKISGFGVDKFSSIEAMVKKIAGKSLCYLDEGEDKHVLIEMPEDLGYGDQIDYTGLIKNDE